MKAEELKAKYMDSKMVRNYINLTFSTSYKVLIMLHSYLQKPETEYTKQGYLFLMEKSKLSKC